LTYFPQQSIINTERGLTYFPQQSIINTERDLTYFSQQSINNTERGLTYFPQQLQFQHRIYSLLSITVVLIIACYFILCQSCILKNVIKYLIVSCHYEAKL
jgi:hypothetical protein